MPMSFPDMKSLITHAEMVKFRAPVADESEQSYRNALADFVAPLDFIESQEIRTSRGWDQWDKRDNMDMLSRSYQRTKLD